VCDALIGYLQSNRFQYTLDLSRIGRSPEVRAMDPIERFLLVEPVGHCEYFAAAFVAMAQSFRIQARIVTGFMTLADVENARQFTVLDRDAHAWAEIRADEHRWIRYDPTVVRRLDRTSADTGLLARLNRWYDEAETWWRLNVLGYDAVMQDDVEASMMARPAHWARQGVTSVGAAFGWLDQAFGFRRLGSVYAIAFMAILAATGLLLLKRWRRRARFHARLGIDSARRRPVEAAYAGPYGALLRVLSTAGLAKPEAVTPLEWCRRLERTHPEATQPAGRVVEAFYAVRFGGRRDGVPDVKSLLLDVSKVAATLGVTGR